MNSHSLSIGALGILLYAPSAVAQNLVPNGSFEEITICPEFAGYVQYATGWVNLHTNSADYYNRCQPNQVVGVPFSTCGYQQPAEGDAYVGMATSLFNVPWYREIVGIELVEPLQSGVPICLSFKVAVGGFGAFPGNSAIYTAKGIGIRFSNGFPDDWQSFLYPNDAALFLDIVPTDTAIWYSVSGEYIPDSSYTHLAVGNFFADSLSGIALLDSSGYGTSGASYAFIDDLRASYKMDFCHLNVGLEAKIPAVSDIRANPNPFAAQFIVKLGRPAYGELSWNLLDGRGRSLMTGIERPGVEQFSVVTDILANGAYVLVANDNNGAFSPLRLICLSH